MWQNADPGLADVCMAQDVQVWQPLTENSFKGLDKYTDQLEDHYAKVRLFDSSHAHVRRCGHVASRGVQRSCVQCRRSGSRTGSTATSR